MEKCPVCGSTRLAVNPITGELVCQDCGTVLEENPFDDTPVPPHYDPLHHQKRARRAMVERRMREVISSLDTRRWGEHQRSRGFEEVDQELISQLKTGFPPYRILRRRTLAAVAVYVRERSEGASKTDALKSASRRTGVSMRTLERIIREYRDWIEEAVRRAARG